MTAIRCNSGDGVQIDSPKGDGLALEFRIPDYNKMLVLAIHNEDGSLSSVPGGWIPGPLIITDRDGDPLEVVRLVREPKKYVRVRVALAGAVRPHTYEDPFGCSVGDAVLVPFGFNNTEIVAKVSEVNVVPYPDAKRIAARAVEWERA